MTTRRADRLLIAAFLIAIGVALFLALAPWGTESMSASSSNTSSGLEAVTVTETTTESLLAHEGPSVLLPLSVPVLLAGIALARRTRRTSLVMAGLCLVGCFLGLLSIGAFFLPVPVLLFLAARWQRSPATEQVAGRSARVGP